MSSEAIAAHVRGLVRHLRGEAHRVEKDGTIAAVDILDLIDLLSAIESGAPALALDRARGDRRLQALKNGGGLALVGVDFEAP